jgi:hypothetical protein
VCRRLSQFERSGGGRSCDAGFKHDAQRVDDLTIRGMSGVLHVLEKGSPGDAAVYVQDDGIVRKISKDPGTGRFTELRSS